MRNRLTAILSLTLAVSTSVLAADYPSRPITLVVPAPPGGMTDAPLRMIMQDVSQKLGQPIIIDYKAGGSGRIGLHHVIRSKNDGYTLVAINSSLTAVGPVFSKSVDYDVDKDLTPIAGMNTVPITLMVNPALPVTSLEQFIDYSQSQEAPLDIAVPGLGSLTRLIGESLKLETGMNVRYIPYKGDAAGIADVLGGHIHGILTGTPIAYHEAGKLRGIAVSSREPTKALPLISPMADVSPNFNMVGLGAIAGPKGLPPEVIQTLSDAITEAVKTTKVTDHLLSLGLEPLPLTAHELQRYMDKDRENLTDLKSKTGIEVE